MGENIFVDDYEDIEEVEEVDDDINYKLVRINHSNCETRKGLRCLKTIKKVQLKYRVFKRNRKGIYEFDEISNMALNEYAKAYNTIFFEKLEGRALQDVINYFTIISYELALLNDETRPYEYDDELDVGISIHKSDLRNLKKTRNELIKKAIREQLDGIATIIEMNEEDKESTSSVNERRILRRFLR